jgi:hypothetical protein
MLAAGKMRHSAIPRGTRLNPAGLVCIAVLVVPFALTGRTSGIVLAVIVWVVVAALLAQWWRRRNDPRPPSHAV